MRLRARRRRFGFLDLISKTTERRDKLEWNAKYWRQLLTEAGFDLKAGDPPIVPVMLNSAKLAQDIVGFLFPACRRAAHISGPTSRGLASGRSRA